MTDFKGTQMTVEEINDMRDAAKPALQTYSTFDEWLAALLATTAVKSKKSRVPKSDHKGGWPDVSEQRAQRVLDALASGPKRTGELMDLLDIKSSSVRDYCRPLLMDGRVVKLNAGKPNMLFALAEHVE